MGFYVGSIAQDKQEIIQGENITLSTGIEVGHERASSCIGSVYSYLHRKQIIVNMLLDLHYNS